MFLVMTIIYLLAMIVFSSSVRTAGILCAAYLLVLATSVTYDAGNELWKFWLFLAGILTVVAGFSYWKDRSKKEIQDWMDSLKDEPVGPPREQINDD